jgi:glycosyltransferase involved in cell wall biosynthesis
VFLGRFAPAKGPEVAIDVARRTRRPLLMAGKVDGGDREWFERDVAPLVDGERIRIVGEVGRAGKAELLACAAALLFPIVWDEPFGLVVVEALASGTPVVAFRRGSVPELIDDGVTGFLVDDADAMADAVGRVDRLDRAACRLTAERRFSVERMVDDLQSRYEETIALGPNEPIVGRVCARIG